MNHGSYLAGPPRILNKAMTVIAVGKSIVKLKPIHEIKLAAYRNKGKKLNVVIVHVTTKNLLKDIASSSFRFYSIDSAKRFTQLYNLIILMLFKVSVTTVILASYFFMYLF